MRFLVPIDQAEARDSSRDAAPLVSIGLPVFNGEDYIGEAIASVLAQTLSDFELIIYDNASTDRTSAICHQFAAEDRRIHYSRNARNLGAALNYNLCFERARGTYFKWMAHDDAIEPTFLEETVARLEAVPEAVLCCVNVRQIDAHSRTVKTVDSEIPSTVGLSPVKRFATVVLRPHHCTDIFGVFRRRALIGTELHGAYRSSDRVLLAEMALRGPFVKVEAPLLIHRDHSARYVRTAMRRRDQTTTWLDTSRSTPERFQHWRTIPKFMAVVPKSIEGRGARWRCYASVLLRYLRLRPLRGLITDVIWETQATLGELAERGERAVTRRFGRAQHRR